MIAFKAEVPFKDFRDTLDFFEICKNPNLLIEKELNENFDTFGSYYPLYLQLGPICMEMHHSHEFLIEVLLAFFKHENGQKSVKIPYFIQFDIRDPINFVLEMQFREPSRILLKHSLGYREGGWWKNRPLRKKYNHSFLVEESEFRALWDQFCHQYFFLLLKLYGAKNCLVEHFRFLNTLLLLDSRKTSRPFPFPVQERKYMELFQVVEYYTHQAPTDDSQLGPVLEKICFALYQETLDPWLNEMGESGIFLGKPIISKKEDIGTAIAQYILLTYPNSEKMSRLLGNSFLKM